MKSINHNISAVILAGGRGTRLSALTKGHQKCLQKFEGKPFLSYLIDQLRSFNINEFYIMTGYRSQDVINTLNNYNNITIHFIKEKEPLGTGGCLKLLESKIHDENLLILNGDTYLDITKEMFNLSIDTNNLDKIDSLFFLGKSFSKEGKVSIIKKKDNNNIYFQKKDLNNLSDNYINNCFSGWALIPPKLIQRFPSGKYNFEEMFEIIQNTTTLNSKTFQTNTYFYDFGTPNRYKQLSHFFKTRNNQ